jgi:bifunctional enzyme CysN/CysC
MTTRLDAEQAYAGMDLLRLATAGSVDDGKSTLIGRLLYDTKSIFEDQLEQIEGASRRLGEVGVNLALLTDGLRAEREQKITIDVAYRYFATPRRKFIIADTPGHLQYTRNMVTGASTADVAVVLVDARKGVLTQSRRHAFIASLLGIPHVIVAVNKMDLVDWSQEVYDRIVADFQGFATKLTVSDISFVPMSALLGDNVVTPSAHMPWYQGGPLLHRLESISSGGRRNVIDFRFPVQTVIRPNQGFRGYAGSVASGSVRPGDDILALPSGVRTRVRSIVTFDGDRPDAVPGDAVVLTLEHEVDIARGDMLVRARNLPTVADRFDAYICWMGEQPLQVGQPYVLLHTSRDVQAFVERIEYRVDVDTMHREQADALSLNEIGRVEIVTARPVFFDSYRVNSATGSFVLIDPATNVTVAGGMIRGEVRSIDETVASLQSAAKASTETPVAVSPNVQWEAAGVSRAAREARQGHGALVVWLTGPSGAGKSSIGRALEQQLFDRGKQVVLLDGDQLRHGLCGDLGFSPEHRAENIRRAGSVAQLFFESGAIVICTFVSPYAADRARVQSLVPHGRFLEVHVTASLDTLRSRDVKGLYAREAAGEPIGLTGVSAPYEAPTAPALRIDTDVTDQSTAGAQLLALVLEATTLGERTP